MKTVTRKDIAITISAKLGLSTSACEELVSKITTAITNLIINEKALYITNFGRFEVKSKKARPGQDIARKASVTIPAKNVVRFAPSRNLKEIINQSKK